MDQASITLISLLLPEGILDYFELTRVDKSSKELHIYLEEKNIAPDGYQKSDLESKGFFGEISFNNFPLRDQSCFLKLKK